MATHSSVLAWRIPGLGEPGGLPSMGVAQSQTRLTRLSSSSSMCKSQSPNYLPLLFFPLVTISLFHTSVNLYAGKEAQLELNMEQQTGSK